MPETDSIDWSAEPDLQRLRAAYVILKKRPMEAVPLLEQLADQGSPMSAVYLGETSEWGKGTNIDFAIAEKWYRQGADNGCPIAIYILGKFYLRRLQYEKAKIAFEAAASRGDIPSIGILGWMHYNGRGVAQDLDVGKTYLEHASTLGNLFARRHLATILMNDRTSFIRRLKGILLVARVCVDGVVVALSKGPTDYRIRS